MPAESAVAEVYRAPFYRDVRSAQVIESPLGISGSRQHAHRCLEDNSEERSLYIRPVV
jgi:hypothetical protein